MGLRIFTEPQQGASYEELLAVARTAEENGYDAFFRSDHLLKFGTGSGLPAITDAWTTLAGLARDTSRLRLGTLVTPVTFRSIGTFPVLVAQVDHMSGGRLEVGLGAGWFEDEHAAYNLDFPPIATRYDRLEDQLEILDGVWAAAPGTTFEHVGRTATVRLPADSLRPAQQPHPPIVIGGRGGVRNARLAARYGDEYNIAFVAPDVMRSAHDAVRSACEAAGRDPKTMVFSVAQTLCCASGKDELARRTAAIGRDVDTLRQSALAGTPGEIVDRLGDFVEAGAERVYLQVLDLSDLDQLRLVADEVQPHVASR